MYRNVFAIVYILDIIMKSLQGLCVMEWSTRLLYVMEWSR